MALIEALSPDVVKVPLVATARNEVLEELVQILDNAGSVKDPQAALDALEERERLGSTGMEKGIAIPHAQTESVDKLTIAIGIAPEGVDFDSMDGKPSKIFFLILTAPEQSHAHLEALSEIARLSASEDLLCAIVDSRSPSAVLELLREHPRSS
jgi:nitrogen PTS system EIIA component